MERAPTDRGIDFQVRTHTEGALFFSAGHRWSSQAGIWSGDVMCVQAMLNMSTAFVFVVTSRSGRVLVLLTSRYLKLFYKMSSRHEDRRKIYHVEYLLYLLLILSCTKGSHSLFMGRPSSDAEEIQ